MIQTSRYTGALRPEGFLSQLKHNKGFSAILIVAAVLLLGLLNTTFAGGFMLAMKILQGAAVLGGIFY